MSTVATARPSRTAPALWLAATQAVMLISLLPWALVTGLSLLSTGAHDALMPRPLLVATWFYPLLPLACCTLAWAAFRRGDTRRAVTLTTVPLLAALPLVVYAWYMLSNVG